jgi:hypothetical protein
MTTYNVVNSASAEVSARAQGWTVRLLLGLLRWLGYTPEQPPQGQVVVRINNLDQVDPNTGLTELGRAIVGKADLNYIRALVRMGADFVTRHTIKVEDSSRDALMVAFCGRYNDVTIGSALEQALLHNPAALAVLREERPETVAEGLNRLLGDLIKDADNLGHDEDDAKASLAQRIELALAAGARFTPQGFERFLHGLEWRRLPSSLVENVLATQPTLTEVYQPYTMYSFEGYGQSCSDLATVQAANKENKPLTSYLRYPSNWEGAIRNIGPQAEGKTLLLWAWKLGVPFYLFRTTFDHHVLKECATFGCPALAEAMLQDAPDKVIPATAEERQALLQSLREYRNNPAAKKLLARPELRAIAAEAQPTA